MFNPINSLVKAIHNKLKATQAHFNPFNRLPPVKSFVSNYLTLYIRSLMKEVQLERCGTAQYTQTQHNTDITDSGGAESVKLQCPKSHTQVS